MVKMAFADSKLSEALSLTSANSINIGRLLPQMTYYAYASHQHFLQTGKSPTIIVPSGNFGNITAGLFVQKMGFPIANFIAATNANDVVPQYFSTGEYHTKPSVQTISNAMDVGNPSNMERIFSLFENDLTNIKKHLTAYSVSDEDTKKTMQLLNDKQSYIADPHTAVGVFVANKFSPDTPNLVMATAHPAKFKDDVENVLGIEISLPRQLSDLLDMDSLKINIDNDFDVLKAVLLAGK
jgi:threonine synthase